MNMDMNDSKELSIRVRCGNHERELTFPVPAGMQEWMERIKLPSMPEENDDPMNYTIEGSRNIKITLTLFDLRRKF